MHICQGQLSRVPPESGYVNDLSRSLTVLRFYESIVIKMESPKSVLTRLQIQTKFKTRECQGGVPNISQQISQFYF